MKRIQGKNALITGGSRGLGPYIALALAREGVNIALTARSEEGLIATAGDVSQFQVTCKTYPADIIDSTSRIELLENVKKDVGEIIVNPGATFLMTAMDAIHPGIMTWVLRTFGVYEFYRQQALDNEAQMAGTGRAP